MIIQRSKKEVVMTLAPNMADMLKNARGTRGRLPGTKIGNGS